jgi:predicted dehydrogenase
MLKVCLVGAGGISGAHIPAWDAMPDAELAALCDIRPGQMEKYPEKHHYTDLGAMLEAEKPDILDICVPTFLHADFTVQALERGIHVLCEKPVSLKAEDVSRVYGAAERNHVKFMVAQVLRFWPEYEYVKRVFDSGEYGALLSGSMERLSQMPVWSWDGWYTDEKRSGLVPFDLHIHDLDFLVYAFGAPKKYSFSRSKRPDQDSLAAMYEFDGGFSVMAQAAWYAAPYPFRMQFRFQFERAVLSYESGKLTVWPKDGKPFGPFEEQAVTGALNLPGTNAYANEIRYFADCVLQNRPADKIKPRQLESVIHILGSLK